MTIEEMPDHELLDLFADEYRHIKESATVGDAQYLFEIKMEILERMAE